MENRIELMHKAIRDTLNAITDGREQVEHIFESLQREVQILEEEYEKAQQACIETIEKVESLEHQTRVARQRLVSVNRQVGKYSESDMKKAYDDAYEIQNTLTQWQEREAQMRIRRDDIARRLKSARATAQEAEVLLVRFSQAATSIDVDFGDIAGVLEDAHVLKVIGVRVLQMQEDERRQLARQLHDGPMQHLASASMMLQSVMSKETGEWSQTTEVRKLSETAVRGRLNGVIDELKNMVFELRPPLLDDLGLVPTLKRYALQWQEHNDVEVKVALVGLEVRLGPTQKATLFRSVQEALSNVVRHSEATQVDIHLSYLEEELRIQVIDNGVGMPEDPDWMDWIEDGRLGLTISKQRLNLLGGELGISTPADGGFTVSMSLPIERGGKSS